MEVVVWRNITLSARDSGGTLLGSVLRFRIEENDEKQNLSDEEKLAVCVLKQYVQGFEEGGTVSLQSLQQLLKDLLKHRGSFKDPVTRALAELKQGFMAVQPGTDKRRVLLRDLRSILNMFTAYVVAAFEDDIKEAGLTSPLLPATKKVEDVVELVKRNGERIPDFVPRGPNALAKFAMRILHDVHLVADDASADADLLTAAFMTGHVELAAAVLTEDGAGRLTESTIIQRLVVAWNGYTTYPFGLTKPLQEKGASQASDWLDYKCGLARAVLTGYVVVIRLVNALFDEQGQMDDVVKHLVEQPHGCKSLLLASESGAVAFGIGGNGNGRSTSGAGADPYYGNGFDGALPAVRAATHGIGGMMATNKRVNAVRAVGRPSVSFGMHGPHQSGPGTGMNGDSAAVEHTTLSAGPSMDVDGEPNGLSAQPESPRLGDSAAGNAVTGRDSSGSAASRARPGSGGGEEGDGMHDMYELDEEKWKYVMLLFARAAACKPLAVAMMYYVLTQKRKLKKQSDMIKEMLDNGTVNPRASIVSLLSATGAGLTAANLRASSMQGGAGDGAHSQQQPGGSKKDGTDGGTEEGGGNEGSEEDPEEAAEEKREKLEKAKTELYRRFHRMVVQAGHLAVHSTSLAVVSDAMRCIKAVRAWPAINLEMLNDLAAHFPNECSRLLAMIPLEEVDLEDNVLPFALPPGFITVAVSDRNGQEFAEEGGSGSTQDAKHFSTQKDADASIESSLLVQAKTWLSLMFLFWPREFQAPTTQLVLRVAGGVFGAFIKQGIGSTIVAAAFLLLLALFGAASRLVVALWRMLYYGLIHRLWASTKGRFPELEGLRKRLHGRYHALPGTPHSAPSASTKAAAAAMRGSAPNSPFKPPPTAATANGTSKHHGSGRVAPAAGLPLVSDSDEDPLERLFLSARTAFTSELGSGLWKSFFAKGHDGVIDKALGWGRGSASISCRKVPLPLPYASERVPAQLDTMLMEKLLRAPALHPSVFGSPVMRAMILFKWNYFTRYFILLQLLLHCTYMALFVVYSFSIKDMVEVDGRTSGPGSGDKNCKLPNPTRLQSGLLIVLAIMTLDFVWQEIRQIWHFGLSFLTHAWDLLDVCSIAVVVASITLHFSCSSAANPSILRGLAATQIVLLFMRLLYYAMASDKLGSFVRMVLETGRDLILFFIFLSVIFVGFALAIIISQGVDGNVVKTFIKLFTMIFGDFDVNFLDEEDAGPLGLDPLTRVLASMYMILVTIILLNLLIAIINESYERIRENEQWESLRNKALLVVESETQLFSSTLKALYKNLCPAELDASRSGRGERLGIDQPRWLYVITPERARAARGADDEDDEEEEEEGEEEDNGNDQWQGRMGELKRHTTTQVRTVQASVQREMAKLMVYFKAQAKREKEAALKAKRNAENEDGASDGTSSTDGRSSRGSRRGGGGGGGGSRRALLRPELDDETLRRLTGHVTQQMNDELVRRLSGQVTQHLHDMVGQQVRATVQSELADKTVVVSGVASISPVQSRPPTAPTQAGEGAAAGAMAGQ